MWGSRRSVEVDEYPLPCPFLHPVVRMTMYTQKSNSHVGLGEWGCPLGISSGMNGRRLDLHDIAELLDQSSNDLVLCENSR